MACTHTVLLHQQGRCIWAQDVHIEVLNAQNHSSERHMVQNIKSATRVTSVL